MSPTQKRILTPNVNGAHRHLSPLVGEKSDRDGGRDTARQNVPLATTYFHQSGRQFPTLRSVALIRCCLHLILPNDPELSVLDQFIPSVKQQQQISSQCIVSIFRVTCCCCCCCPLEIIKSKAWMVPWNKTKHFWFSCCDSWLCPVGAFSQGVTHFERWPLITPWSLYVPFYTWYSNPNKLSGWRKKSSDQIWT